MKQDLQESDIQLNGGSASHRKNNLAFTLIELLVVIAIIAVLTAILLPALTIAKNRAQMAIDLNHVHQILLASHLYASDNNDFLPRPGYAQGAGSPQNWCVSNPWAQSPNCPGTKTDYDLWYPRQVKSFKGLDYTTNKALPRSQACQLAPYLKNEKVLRCPADVPNVLMYQRQMYVTSYVWSMVVVGDAVSGSDLLYGTTWTAKTLKLSQFKPTGIMMWENDELMVTNCGVWCDMAAYPHPLEGHVSSRHGKGSTVGRFSGAAERILLSDWYRMANESVPNDLRCNPISTTGY